MTRARARARHPPLSRFFRARDETTQNHFGIEVGDRPLDDFVAPLEAANVSWSARAGAAGEGGWSTDIGSLWTGGSGAQGVELHGQFAWSALSRFNVTGMDYCSSPATAGATARGADALAGGDGGGAAAAAQATGSTAAGSTAEACSLIEEKGACQQSASCAWKAATSKCFASRTARARRRGLRVRNV